MIASVLSLLGKQPQSGGRRETPLVWGRGKEELVFLGSSETFSVSEKHCRGWGG